LSVMASSGNTGLLPQPNVLWGPIADPWETNWFLYLTPATNQSGTAALTLTATNDAGPIGTGTVLVVVSPPSPIPVGDWIITDPNLTNWVNWVPNTNTPSITNAPWFSQTLVSHMDHPAAQSGSISNNGRSSLIADVTGPGTLSFWWRVSSETNYDFMKFYIGTNEQARISGEVDWQQRSYACPPGQHTLWWDFCKDPNVGRGMDAGWVAQVSFVPASWLQVAGRPINGQCQLILYGQPGMLYQILCSTNLADWFPLGTVMATNNIMPFIDLDAGAGVRFYQLLELQGGSVRLEGPYPLSNGVQLVIHSPPGLRIEMQASTNLASWSPLALLTNVHGTVYYTDRVAASFPMRSYRAAVIP
jgi:hypothetical protein